MSFINIVKISDFKRDDSITRFLGWVSKIIKKILCLSLSVCFNLAIADYKLSDVIVHLVVFVDWAVGNQGSLIIF